MSEKKQKLELTWIGKDKRPRLEPRVLVEDAAKSHHATTRRRDGKDIFDNMLIHGDNLLALKALAQQFTGKVKSIYIDPPYNTGNAFEHYDDGLEHSIWLGLMRDRLDLLHKLLSDDGLLFVQIDDSEQAYLTLLTDEIFGRDNRLNTICFKMSEASGVKMAHVDKRQPKLKVSRRWLAGRAVVGIISSNLRPRLSGRIDTDRRSSIPNTMRRSLPMITNILQGSIFSLSYDDADGVAVFVPCGLTAIRMDFQSFISSTECVHKANTGINVYKKADTGQTVVAFENPANIMISMDEAKHIVESVLETMAQFSIRRIAMNGIRFAAEDQSSWQERELVKWVLDWCHINANGFEFITFVDLRGGFDFLKEGRVHILHFAEYELEEDGFTVMTNVEGAPHCKIPEGQTWHVVLGRFVPKSWAKKEMWVEREAVFGTDYEKERQ